MVDYQPLARAPRRKWLIISNLRAKSFLWHDLGRGAQPPDSQRLTTQKKHLTGAVASGTLRGYEKENQILYPLEHGHPYPYPQQGQGVLLTESQAQKKH